MSRNLLLVVVALLAVVVGVLVSYFPPPQNAVAIWSMVNLVVGYGIRDLFVADAPAAQPPVAPPATDPVAPAATPVP